MFYPQGITNRGYSLFWGVFGKKDLRFIPAKSGKYLYTLFFLFNFRGTVIRAADNRTNIY